MKQFTSPEPKINLNRVFREFNHNIGSNPAKDELLKVIDYPGFQYLNTGSDYEIFAVVNREETESEYHHRVSCEKSSHALWVNARNIYNKQLHAFEEEQALKTRKKIARGAVYKNPEFIEFLRQTKDLQEVYGKLVLPMNHIAWKNDEYQAYMENANKFLKNGYEDFLPKELVTMLKVFS